jgi:hypothetical protein
MHITAVLRIRIRIQIPQIHVFLGLLDPDPDPDPLVRGMDPDPDPSNINININKNSRKNLDFSCFVTSFHRILRNYNAMTSYLRTYVYCDIVITKLRLSRHRNYEITHIPTS